MGRLVDADALLEYYKRLSNECFSANNHEYANLYDCVCAKIATQPTAYSVEKVVAELEEEKKRLRRLPNDCISLCDREVIGIEEKAYNFAIDIVKRGGVE